MRGCSVGPVQYRLHRAQVNNKDTELLGLILHRPGGIKAIFTLSATTDHAQGISTPLHAPVWCVLKTYYMTFITLHDVHNVI